MIIPDLRRRSSVHRVEDHRSPVPPAALRDAADNGSRDLRHIRLLKLCLTIRTVSAVSASVLPEIPENILPEAVIRKAVECHLF